MSTDAAASSTAQPVLVGFNHPGHTTEYCDHICDSCPDCSTSGCVWPDCTCPSELQCGAPIQDLSLFRKSSAVRIESLDRKIGELHAHIATLQRELDEARHHHTIRHPRSHRWWCTTCRTFIPDPDQVPEDRELAEARTFKVAYRETEAQVAEQARELEAVRQLLPFAYHDSQCKTRHGFGQCDCGYAEAKAAFDALAQDESDD